MFSSRVMTDFIAHRETLLGACATNQHQQATSAVTRLLVSEVWHPAMPTTANQVAQTELGSRSYVHCIL